jgi:hypothetical protein
LHRTPHLGSDVESIFTCAKAVEHKVAGCIARMDRRAFLPILEIDFNRVDQTGLPDRAQRVDNVSMLQPEASGTDRRIAAMQYYFSRSGDEQIKIGHRSNYAHDPFRSSAPCELRRSILLIGGRQRLICREWVFSGGHPIRRTAI